MDRGRVKTVLSFLTDMEEGRRCKPTPKFEGLKDLLFRERYVEYSRFTPVVARKALSPAYLNPPARKIQINTGIGHRGPIKYSSTDLIGTAIRKTYLVLDETFFRDAISEKLEALFFKKNPNPGPRLKRAFTHMMHNNNLHWSGCTHRTAGSHG